MEISPFSQIRKKNDAIVVEIVPLYLTTLVAVMILQYFFTFLICSSGVGRTGAFIGIYAQLERLKNEGEMDLFQYIKSIRLQRAGLILNEVSH